MTTTPPPSVRPVEYDDEEINLVELLERARAFARLAWRERLYVWRSLAVTVPLGLLVAFGGTPEFTASAKLLPYRPSGSSTSGLSGLAGLAGIRLSGGPSDPTITADLYPDVANTLDFRISVAETPIRFASLGRAISTTTYFRDVSRPSVVSFLKKYTIGLPGLISSSIRPAEKPMAIRDSAGGQAPLAHYSRGYLKIVEGLEDRLAVSIDRKTTIITIEGTMPDAYASADLVKVASDRLMQRIIDYESRKAGEQLRFVQEEQRRSRERFQQAQRDLATFTDRNRGTLSATAQIETQRLQSEYDLSFDLYTQFSRDLEQSLVRQNQDTPVFTVLDQVVVPNSRSSPRRALDLLGSLFFGVLAGMSIIGWREYKERRQ